MSEPQVNDAYIGERIDAYHAADVRRADRLIGAQIGMWRVGKPAMPGWYAIAHERDGSTRILRAVDLLALAEQAQTNGHAFVTSDHEDEMKEE